MKAWTAPSHTRIGETEPTRKTTRADVSLGRNETQSFQIIVRGPVTNCRVEISDLVSERGVRIPAPFTLYRQHYITVAQGSPDHGVGAPNRPLGAGRYADALISFLDPSTGAPPTTARFPAQPFSVAKGVNQPVWVDVETPISVPPGVYTATWTVRSDQGVASGRVVVRVWSFALPTVPALASCFSFGNGDTGTTDGNIEMLHHRLSPITVPPNEAAMYQAFGQTGASLGFWSGGNASTPMSAPPTVDAVKARKALFGSLPVYNYTADEITFNPSVFPRVIEWAKVLHQAGVKQLITMGPHPALMDDGTGRPAVDIWVVLPRLYSDAQAVRARMTGCDIWSYNALCQDDYSPKWLLDYPSPNFRLQSGFLSAAGGFSGLLYWKVDNWVRDPWVSLDNTGAYAPGNNYPGEGVLLYPGADVGVAGPVPSIRLKWLRDGVNDYDYVRLLEQRGKGALARQVVSTVATDWRTWSRDPVAIAAARLTLGAELHKK